MTNKIQISLDSELMERADNYANKNYYSRSGLISTALTEYLNSREFMTIARDMSISLRKIADNGNIDENTLNEFKSYAKVFEVMGGSIK